MPASNHFAIIGLPCRAVDDKAVYDAYREKREKWFLRQFEPRYAQKAPGRLKQIELAYQSIRYETDRRRYLTMLMRTSRVLKDRRRAELDGLAKRLSERGPLTPDERNLLRHKARGLGLPKTDADRAVTGRAPRRDPGMSRRDYFRFCVEMAVNRGYLPPHKHERLLRQAVACGLSDNDAQQVIAQVLFASEAKRRTIIDRLFCQQYTGPGSEPPTVTRSRLAGGHADTRPDAD